MPNADAISALRQAATVLLADAPLPVVRATLRALLADTDAEISAPPRPSPVKAILRRSQPKPTPQPDSGWDARRREIRAAMLSRGVSYKQLAHHLGVVERTARHTVGRRQAPSVALRRRFDAWMAKELAPKVVRETVPAVASENQPFRGNGNGNGNGRAFTASPGDAAARIPG